MELNKRLLDGAMFHSPKFAGLPPMGRLFQVGLISAADSQGRFLANLPLLRSLIFPYDDVGVDQAAAWLNTIAGNGTLILYRDSEGRDLAQFANWWGYQAPQYASPSKYESPPGWKDRIRYTVTRGRIVTHNWRRRDGTLMADTCDERGMPYDPDLADLLAQGVDEAGDEGEEGEGGEGGSSPGKGPQPPGAWPGPVQGRILSDDPPSKAQREADERARQQEGKPGKLGRLKASHKELTGFADLRKFDKNGKVAAGKGVTPVEVYYEIHPCTGETKLNTIQMEQIAKVVTDLDVWRETIIRWGVAGHRPRNVKGQLDWYLNGGQPSYQSGGKSAANRGGSQRTWATAAQRGVRKYDPDLEKEFAK